ncbi:neprilysin-2 [Cephus cinctus]|uniref:Neprilysin-2 n=1 Tax=Cephus cinctus TaxID=211228 RepID=A0AAJ7BNK8_CEPCN|nr:neprilysin-2 [Cephus cinctus]
MQWYRSILSIIVILIFQNFVNSEECQYAECIAEANRIKSIIDESLNPCEDFMEFSCGRLNSYYSQNSYKYPRARSSVLIQHYETLESKIIEELDEPVRPDEHRGISLAKLYWQSCKITKPAEAAYGLELVFNRLGKWPMATPDWDMDFSWINFSISARKLGFMPKMFIDVGLNLDDVDKAWSINDTLTFRVERAKFHPLVGPKTPTGMRSDDFYSTIVKRMLGNRSNIFNMDDMVKDLAGVHDFRMDIFDMNHGQKTPILEMKQVSIAELQKTYPYVNWMEYLRAMLPRKQANYLSDRNCVLIEPCFLSNIDELLKKTDKRILANHGFLVLIDEMTLYNRPLVNLILAKDTEEVEDICYKSTKLTFSRALDMIVAKFAGPITKAKVTELQTRIAHEAHQIFHRIPWMDHLTQLHAAKKSERTTFVNVYSDDIFDTNYFDRLDFTKPNAILVLFRELNIFLRDQYFLQIGRPRAMYALRRIDNQTMQAMVRTPFAASDVVVKPERITNEVYIPAGALGPGRFSTLPELDFMNYAVIGLQIALSMGLQIYEKGSFIDSNLQWREKSWWTQTTQRHWCSLKACREIAQLKPLDSLDITFGYIGAAEIAYKSFFYWKQQKMCNVTLPGLKYTTRQLFWIAAATANCDPAMKPRYNWMVANNCNFGVDFGCPVGSRMNLMNKCKMWIP